MRALQTVFILLLLLSVLAAGIAPASAAPGYTAKTSRTVWVTPYYTQVKDVILINNTGTGAMSYIDFKISAQEYASLYSIGASDSVGHSLTVSLLGAPFQSFSFYRIYLSNPLLANQIASVTLNRFLLFYGLFGQSGSNVSLVATISPTILLLNPIFKANFTLILPSHPSSFGFAPTSYTLGNTTFKFMKNASSFNIKGNLTKVTQPDQLQVVTISFTGDAGAEKGTDNVYVTSAQTTLNLGDTISASTIFVVYDARGASGIGKTSPILLTMPAAVDSVSASDLTGALTTTMVRSTSSFNVTVNLRYDLNRNQTYTFTLNYQMRPDNIVTKSGDTYAVNLTSVSPYIPFVINHQVTIIAPYGSTSLQSHPTPSVQGNSGGSGYVQFNLVNSSALAGQNVQLSFNYAWYWGLIRPWFYLSFIYLLGLVSAAVYLRQKPLKAPVAPGTIEDLKKFCDLYDNKTALALELQSMEDSLRRGKITKPLYDKRVSEIEVRRVDLDRQLSELGRNIRQTTPRYAKNLDQIELLEAELRTVNATVKDLQRQYAARKVSRRVYDDLTYTYEGRQRKIQGRIDALIISLREGR